MVRTGRSNSRGFSLAEILVALLLLSVVSLVLTGVVPATITGMRKASQRANATMLAQSKMDELMSIGFGLIEASVEPPPVVPVAGTDYTVRINVQPALLSDGTPMDEDECKLVTVEVTWLDRNDPKRVYQRQVFFKRV